MQLTVRAWLVGKGHFQWSGSNRLNLGKDSGHSEWKNLKAQHGAPVHRLQLSDSAGAIQSRTAVPVLWQGTPFKCGCPAWSPLPQLKKILVFLHNLAESSPNPTAQHPFVFRGKKRSPWWLHSLMINHDKLKPLLKTPVFQKALFPIQQSLWRQTQWPWCLSIMVFWAFLVLRVSLPKVHDIIITWGPYATFLLWA